MTAGNTFKCGVSSILKIVKEEANRVTTQLHYGTAHHIVVPYSQYATGSCIWNGTQWRLLAIRNELFGNKCQLNSFMMIILFIKKITAKSRHPDYPRSWLSKSKLKEMNKLICSSKHLKSIQHKKYKPVLPDNISLHQWMSFLRVVKGRNSCLINHVHIFTHAEQDY